VLEGIEAARRGPVPALVVCHRGSIRLALAALHRDEALRTADVPNASLLELP
jgi:broad specificity phosphatase PhoE